MHWRAAQQQESGADCGGFCGEAGPPEEGRSTAAAAQLHVSVPARRWWWALSVLRWRRMQAVWTQWMAAQLCICPAEYGGACGEAGPLSAESGMARPRERLGLHATRDGGPWTTDGTGDTQGSTLKLFGQGRAEECAWPRPYGARPGLMAWHAVRDFESLPGGRWPSGAGGLPRFAAPP